jgi:L-malate glycosyltransferase
MKRKVAIVVRLMSHYRVPLFELMREQLAVAGVTLRVLYGDPAPADLSKRDTGVLPWAEHLSTRWLANGRICWQPFMSRVRDCDLLVVVQENKLVNNLFPVLNPWRHQALAFWGHGANLQARRPDGWAERFKRWTTRRADWYFAYTAKSARLVQKAGFPGERITVLNNSIDTAVLRRQVELARQTPRATLRASFGLHDRPVGVFVGSLYPEKRIGWLLDVAATLRDRVPGFQLAVAGAGPEQRLVQEAASGGTSIVYLGPLHGQQVRLLLACADVMLNPGLVGLVILDAFAAGLPLATVQCESHGPEIEYLEHGVNGVITADDMESYVSACVSLCGESDATRRMKQAASDAARHYTIEYMARQFTDGICQVLASARVR